VTLPDLGTILGVWAHPDDEGYLSAGLMTASVAAGRRVVCVTATRGEAADPERWPPAELADIRTNELKNALDILGVVEHHWLDYPDGGCHEVDPEEPVALLAALIDDVQPDTVLTFGPDGMTGHPDHIAVSDWTAAAVQRANHRADLFFATKTAEWADAFEQIGNDLGVMMGADQLPRTPPNELAIHYVMPDDVLDRKEAAMVAQESQSAELRNAMGVARYREVLREEPFRRP